MHCGPKRPAFDQQEVADQCIGIANCPREAPGSTVSSAGQQNQPNVGMKPSDVGKIKEGKNEIQRRDESIRDGGDRAGVSADGSRGHCSGHRQ
jgi:hypothetical protein